MQLFEKDNNSIADLKEISVLKVDGLTSGLDGKAGENHVMDLSDPDDIKGVTSAGPNATKPKSSWIRLNRMDFGLGGLQKVLLPSIGKRHLPLEFEQNQNSQEVEKFKKGFKFEEAWLLWDDCGAVVKDAWEKMGGADLGLASIKEKIKFCGEELQMEECLNAVPRKVTPDMQDALSIRNDDEEVWVSSLINQDLHVWRRDVIMANFNREEEEAICDIPLSRRQVLDSVYWKHSKDGNFTVKSAYRVAQSLLKKVDWAEPSSGGGTNRVWAALWKQRIPNKMKVFGWRTCHDILPTRRSLKKKRVLSEDLCPFCSRFQISTIHVLWECTAAQDIWHGSARALQKCGIGQTDFVALLEYLLDRLEKTEVEQMMVQAWLIWNQQNRVVHGGQFLEPGWLNKRVVELLEEFQRSQEALLADMVQAVFTNNTSFGFGAVIRNSRGEVMASMTVKGPAVQCSEEAELLAYRKAMEFAIDAGFTVLIVEGDSINAMRGFVSVKDNQSALGLIVGDIRHLMGALEWISNAAHIALLDLTKCTEHTFPFALLFPPDTPEKFTIYTEMPFTSFCFEESLRSLTFQTKLVHRKVVGEDKVYSQQNI
ncbi:hypothetical protein SO802_012953 [Lithocarpus litseifolius]|uniref:Reverse transcriptase zinc-binding domain-containing protein n=1 Tax=Lithocarpus litseifolius TaxID=425828 RepID=A0AAW2D481_9ROSI